MNAVKRKVVLIVEDVPENIVLLDEILREDYTVKIAKNGAVALKIASLKPRPDIILLDIMMPDMDGYSICRSLKRSEQTRDIPVIFVTAQDTVDDEIKGLEAGAVDYITKPVSPPIVKARVKSQIALRTALQCQKRQNRELLEAARLREDVERITRHDLKSPLSGILTYSQLLLNMEGEERKLRYIKKIEAAGRKILKMINRSLDLFKMEQGLYEFNPGIVDVIPLINAVCDENSRFIKMKQIAIHCTIEGIHYVPGQTFFVQGEELLLYSMLSNILLNAIEASPEHENVIVDLQKGDKIYMHIINRGSVPESIRDTFFDKYVTAGKKTGTGLGTYSARLIAGIHGGGLTLFTGPSPDEEAVQVTKITVELPKYE